MSSLLARKLRNLLAMLLILGVFLVFAAPGAVPPLSTPALAEDPIAEGAWTPGVPWDLTNLNNYVSEVGRKPAVVLWYTSWGPSPEGAFPVSNAQALNDQGYKQVVTWEPQDWHYDKDPNQPSYSLDSIINGSHDAYIRQYADTIKTLSYTIYLRPMHEMNGNWYPWGEGVNGNTPDKFKQAWIHIHDIFQQEGATNVNWVWSPSVRGPVYDVPTPLLAYYPGDAYVDWVALDGYNFSSTHNLPWYSFDQVFSNSYSEVTSLAPAKPVMINETASVEPQSSDTGKSKSQWIADLESVVKSKYPKVKALIWFNQNDGAANSLVVDSSTSALSAYKQLVADPYYQGPMP